MPELYLNRSRMRLFLNRQLIVRLTAAKIHQKGSVEMLVIDEGSVDSGAAGMIDTEVAKLGISSEEVATLLVHHQLLDQLRLLDHVQVEASGRLSGPRNIMKTSKLGKWEEFC